MSKHLQTSEPSQNRRFTLAGCGLDTLCQSRQPSGVDGNWAPQYGKSVPSTSRNGIGRPTGPAMPPRHGPSLLALHAELIWATAWMHDANEVIAPLLGQPQLPVAELPEVPNQDQPGALCWKTLGPRPGRSPTLIRMVDDEFTGLDRTWVSVPHRGHALLHRLDSLDGLTGSDLVTVADWLQNLAAGT